MHPNSSPSFPHRRYNPLKDEWVLVSPQRTQRPWQGRQEAVQETGRPQHDPGCYLCPGNTRANGEKNPAYTDTYVFANDFPALLPDTPEQSDNTSEILRSDAAQGICRVVCFSPRHDLTLADMNIEQIEAVIHTWSQQIEELQQRYAWVQIFENKGAVMGCSNPHPHGQIWASSFIPNEIQTEDKQQHRYYQKQQSPLLVDYVQQELEKKERVVVHNDDWAVVVPFWAVWPYETLLLPKTHIQTFTSLSPGHYHSLATIMKQLLVTYDQLFSTSMPYSMGWHFAPTEDKGKHWQLHAHYYPPLLRSATVKKFMVGYEMLAESQRDITPEQAAETLRRLL